MHPAATRVLTGAATAVVITGAAVGAASGDGSLVVVSLASGWAVAVGWFIVRHEPTSPVGPALAWSTGAIVFVTAQDAVPWATGIWPLNLAGIFALLLVFPDGARHGRVWSVLPWVYVAATAGMVVALWGAVEVGGRVTGPDPAGWRILVGSVSMPLLGVTLALAVTSLFVRYRQGGTRTRQQIRWLLLAGSAVIVLLVGGWLAEAQGTRIGVAYSPFLAAIVVLVPAAVGVAIVRHDLFDVDRILSESASLVVTLVLSAAIFALVVLSVSQVFHRLTNVSSATAAFVTALALVPLHRFVQQLVGRLVDPDQQVSMTVVERFAADVRAGLREPEDIEVVLRQAQGDPELRVLLAGPSGNWLGLDGAPVPEEPGFGVQVGDDEIARIVLGWNSARARRRIATLAKVAWVPIEVSRLRLVLRDALVEANSSRARLADAAAAERKRLERDLHDGAQQRLIATGMRLRLLQLALPPEQATEIDTAIAELRDTVDELRRLANGIRPSQLDDGLEAALSAVREATPIPFKLRVESLPDVDDTRALTAYLVVSEAVANALKHSQASQIEVIVKGRRQKLSVRVVDNGVGGLPPDASLTALRDRVLSVGGTLAVRSPPGKGTTIEAVL